MSWQDNLKNILYVKEDDLHEKFKSFLRRHQVYEFFKHNMKKHPCLNLQLNTDDLFLYLKDVDSSEFQKGFQYINWAFYWDETSEGHYFWESLNDKWRDML